MFDQQNINFTSLLYAIENNDVHMIRIILRNKKYFKYKNQLGESLIHIAVKNNFKELIEYLISEGFDIDDVDYSHRSALHLAVAIKNEDMIKYLLDYKASTKLKDLYGKSPFHTCIQMGNLKLVELFIKNGADILDTTINTLETAFHIALKNEEEEIFKLLLNNYNGNVSVSDVYGETLLHILARQKNKQLVKLLLEKEADLEMINKDNETPLHFAIHNRNFEISKIFVEHGANVNAKNKYGESALHLAIRYKDFKLVKLLLMNNANINEHTNDHNSMLHIAINYFNEDIINLLLDYGANIKSKNSHDLDPFHLAIKNKCIKGAKVLLSKGINVNSVAYGKFISKDHKGTNENQIFTPLLTAIAQKDVNAVEFLLENGAKLDLNNDYEIFLAVEKGCVDIVNLLIKYGANVNAVNNVGQSVLFTAMKVRNESEVQTLLRYGANKQNINETGFENESALHLAVKAKDEKFVQFLLNIGIDINICDKNNSTALYFAQGSTNIANFLIMNIALLKINKFFVHQQNEIIINMVEEFNLYFSKCLNELLEIEMKLCCDVSLMNFLIKDVIILVKFVKRKSVVTNFETTVNSNKYPIYYNKLIKKMEKGIERWNLIKEVKNILLLIDYFEPLYDVLDEIVENLSNLELKEFIKNSINAKNKNCINN